MILLRRLRPLPLLLAIVTIWSCGSDTGTNPDSDPTPEPAGTPIGPSGGTVSLQGATLSIPAGALASEVAITMEPVSAAGAGIPAGFVAVDGAVFDMGPDGLTFDAPVELTLGFDASNIPAGVAPSELGIIHLTGGAEMLSSVVDVGAGTVTASIQGFSSFGVGLEVGTLQRVACPAVAPASLSGMPLDRIALGAVPPEFGSPLAAFVESVGSLEEGIAMITPDGGSPELVVPVHPSTDPAGGSVRVNVTDGTLACAAFDFTIAPLPAAEGELMAIADGFQALVTAQAALFETTPAELIAMVPAELSPSLLPLALMQSVVDHPDNPNSLRAMAEGTWPLADSARLDLVEPLLARTGIRAELEAAAGPAQALDIGSAGGALTAMPGGPARIGAATCTPGAIGDDAGLLDACMRAAASAQFELGGASGKVLNDIGAATGVLGFVPGLGTASTIGGAVAWTALGQKSRTAGLFPSALTGITVDYGQTEFREDEGGLGTWSADVTATSIGFDLGKEALEAMLQGAGVAGLGDSYQVAGPEVDGILAGVLTGPVAAEMLKDGTPDDFRVPAETFGPVDISSETWSRAEIIGDAVALTSHIAYEPRAVGVAELSVATADGAFGGQTQSWRGDVEVLAIDLDITPGDVSLGPAEPQGFSITVANAIQPGLLEVVDPDALDGTVGSITPISDGVYVVDYTAPANPNPSSVDYLTVRHTAETGSRAYSSEERTATAVIRFGRVVITPETACLEPGEPLDFNAQVLGATGQEVEWSADYGSIDAGGYYSAPSTVPAGGVATITAVSVDNSAIRGEVYVQIGGCTCNWDLSMDSGGLVGVPGDGAGFQILDGSGLWTITLGADAGGSVSLQSEGIAIGQTGSFAAFPSGDLGLSPSDLFYSVGESGPLQLFLTENDGQVVAGTASGNVTITPAGGSPPESRQGSFSVSFRIESEGSIPGGGFVAHSCTVTGGGG